MRMCLKAGLVMLVALSAACSRDPKAVATTSPTSPTATTADMVMTSSGGVFGPMDVTFPARSESNVYRNDLEQKYQSLGRSLVQTYVDREGEVVWLQEYIRYRVNGCDHGTSVSRVLTQIDGGAAGAICAAPQDGVAVVFPSRSDVVEARRSLETKYQQMGRSLSTTTVDLEGAAIWIAEYLRYRTNSCDHATAEQKVFVQIDGGAAPATCFVACTYTLAPGGINTSYTGSTSIFEIRPNAVACQWRAGSDSSWLTIPSTTTSGSGFTQMSYTVAANNTNVARSGRINVTWLNGSASFIVNQAANPFVASFSMTDGYRSGSTATDSCWIRSNPTPCVLTANANLPGNNYTFYWTATYTYGTEKVVRQTSSSRTFTINETCGASGSSTDGPTVGLDVQLRIEDDLGNSISLRTGQNSQPNLSMRLFNCS